MELSVTNTYNVLRKDEPVKLLIEISTGKLIWFTLSPSGQGILGTYFNQTNLLNIRDEHASDLFSVL